MPLALYKHQGQWLASFLRINKAGTFQRRGESQFLPLSLRASDGSVWAGVGICFKSNPLACTLLACWDEAHKDLADVTDLLPSGRHLLVQHLAWIECGFKQTKRAGWQWQNTKIPILNAPVVCGWLSPLPLCGSSVWAVKPRMPYLPAPLMPCP